jgi:hypothetical protein
MATDPSALITSAQAYATTTLAAASGALNAAMGVAERIGQGYIGDTGGVGLVVDPPSVFDPGPVPVYDGSRFEPEEFGEPDPELDDPGSLDLPKALGQRPDVPDLDLPDPVEGRANKDYVGKPPEIKQDFDEPDAPDIDVKGIEKPVLTPVTIPKPVPKYVEPEFLGVRPDTAPNAPTDLDLKMKSEYSTISPIMQDFVNTQIDTFLDREFPEYRTAMAKIEERLNTYLDGGSALSPAIENAIYNRALDKVDADARRAKDEAWGKAAKAGFTMPPVVMLSQLKDIDRERRDANARMATEIAIKQAELEQQNLQFAVTQSTNLRKIALDAALAYYSGLVQINGQALEYARSVVDAVVKTYDIAAKYSELQVRIYESEANIYDAKIKGALAVFEGFKAEVEGVMAQVNADKAQVDLYQAQLQSAKIEVEVYQAQVESLRTMMDIEKMKIELYQAKVGAYTAEVNAFTAEWQGYEAAVKGEVAKIEAAATEVQAFVAEANAYKTEVDAKAAKISAILSSNQQKLDLFKTQFQIFDGKEQSKLRAMDLEMTSYSASIKSYEAYANAMADKSKAEVTMYQVAQQALAEAARIQYMYTENMNRTEVAKANAIGEVAGRIGDVYGRVAQATMSGMNSLAASTTTKKE